MCAGLGLSDVSQEPDDSLNAIADRPVFGAQRGVSPLLLVAANSATERARAERDRRTAIRAELEGIAAQRTAEAARQSAELQRLQAAQEQASIDQQNTTAELQRQGELQQQQIGQSRLAVQAAASSAKVLAQGPATSGPTAVVSRPTPARRGARTTQSALRIGGTSQASGTGLNIASTP